MKGLYLEEHLLEIVKNILSKYIPHRRILAFGSRVSGNFKPHSDLDLCIMGLQPLSLKQMARVREAFTESALPMRVDLVEWAITTPSFRAIIQSCSIEILNPKP